MHPNSQPSLFSIDVEEWYNILDLDTAPKVADWHKLPSRVVDNFVQLLEVLDGARVKATCFFLTHTALAHPELVRLAREKGHEIASHGMQHDLVYEMGRDKFRADARESKRILEDISGHPVAGYRAAGFSVTPETPWFFDEVAAAGYTYDSSVFPGRRQHGGMAQAKDVPHIIHTSHGRLVEIPISLNSILGQKLCFVGGGYLRLFPSKVISIASDQIKRQRRPVTYYVHPRDIDPGQPRIAMPAIRRFKTYVGLGNAKQKIALIVGKGEFTTFGDFAKKLLQSENQRSSIAATAPP